MKHVTHKDLERTQTGTTDHPHRPASGCPAAPGLLAEPDESEANLTWNVGVGMVRPDEKLREAIDEALERLRADGTVDRIYQRYGIVLQTPK